MKICAKRHRFSRNTRPDIRPPALYPQDENETVNEPHENGQENKQQFIDDGRVIASMDIDGVPGAVFAGLKSLLTPGDQLIKGSYHLDWS